MENQDQHSLRRESNHCTSGPPRQTQMTSPRVSLFADLLPDQDGLSYDSLNFPLFLHEDVVESVPDHIAFRRRLALVLQHLAAHGRTGVVKSCSDAANRGWRRTPLGGTGGMQYYLWWAPAGSQQVPSTFNSVTGQDSQHLRKGCSSSRRYDSTACGGR